MCRNNIALTCLYDPLQYTSPLWVPVIMGLVSTHYAKYTSDRGSFSLALAPSVSKGSGNFLRVHALLIPSQLWLHRSYINPNYSPRMPHCCREPVFSEISLVYLFFNHGKTSYQCARVPHWYRGSVPSNILVFPSLRGTIISVLQPNYYFSQKIPNFTQFQLHIPQKTFLTFQHIHIQQPTWPQQRVLNALAHNNVIQSFDEKEIVTGCKNHKSCTMSQNQHSFSDRVMTEAKQSRVTSPTSFWFKHILFPIGQQPYDYTKSFWWGFGDYN